MQRITQTTGLTALLIALMGNVLLLAAAGAHAVSGDCSTPSFLPGTPSHMSDSRVQTALCQIDFASNSTAICPKTWSTSAAALVYDLQGTPWDGRRREFEQQVCPRGTHALTEARSELAVFKHSMNFRDTSGTYAPSILLYDHLSRWLGTTVQVPAAAELRFAGDWYVERVVMPGLSLSSEHPSRKMLLAAWQHLHNALLPEQPDEGREFLLPESGDVWGAALLFTGRRYGAEVNGTRQSGWGSGQNFDFQQTAPFLGLRMPGTLEVSAARAIHDARSDPLMADALAANTSPAQVAWWMLEVLDIVVLDYILGQQDRIGNIDYQWRWLWLDEGNLKSVYAGEVSQPPPGALRLRTTWLNDNDAGIRSGYANYARETGMLTGLRHFNPSLYKRIKLLAEDMTNEGPVYSAIADNYHLREKEVSDIARRVLEVDSIITADCKAGNYRFDLAPAVIIGQAQPTSGLSCD